MLKDSWIYMNKRLFIIVTTMIEATTTQNLQNMPGKQNWMTFTIASEVWIEFSFIFFPKHVSWQNGILISCAYK